jgi:hypothetical protein
MSFGSNQKLRHRSFKSLHLVKLMANASLRIAATLCQARLVFHIDNAAKKARSGPLLMQVGSLRMIWEEISFHATLSAMVLHTTDFDSDHRTFDSF